uniref:Uncharacterized protein n=1 Tax=Romanomermis culicivorax TaxID=13658 RepID=A0A915JDW7_ROMCU
SSSLPLDEGKIDGCHSSAVNFNPSVISTTANQLSVGTSQILEQTPLLPRPLKHSRSNPDISKQLLPSSNNTNQISKYYQTPRPACPEHVLKIYRTDQTYKYLSVYKDTTVQSVILMALQEFGIVPTIVDDATQQPCSSKVPSSGDWSLYEVIVNPDNIKRRRLPDHMHNLAERMTLNSRYYLTKNTSCEPLVPDHLAPELLKESQTTLIELNANILAAQLTLQDFSIFASIEPTEYVDNLFQNKNSKYGWPKLENFEHLVNREMWWTATEVCREKNLIRRAKIIKKLIKVARQCRDFKNFNSMFAIVSGLEKPCVRRLHATWDKVSSKSLKMLEDLQLLLDPSRNMSKYRQHLIQTSCEPPVIPLFPVVRKDLYFIHECNATFCDGLINFEKLRMIAKEIRNVTKLASSPYELSAMYEQSGGGGTSRINDALLYMNSFEGGAAIATMRKQFMQRGPLSRKKVYEQALMVRRVKSYLSNLNVIENENELDKMSLECEAQPLSSLGVANSSQNRRRLPSPSPSSASSASRTSSEANKRNLQPKFGVESPQAVQRMLALVDHSKTKNAHHVGSHCRSSSPPILTSPNIFRRPRGGLSGVHHHNNGPFMAGGSQMVAPPLPPPAGSSFTSCYLGHGRSQSESTRQTLNNYQNVTVPLPPPNYYTYHHQTTAPAALHPVDLTAESSSVNILVSPLRLHSSGSVTSTDSGVTNHSNAGSQSSSNLCTNVLLQHQNSAGISHAVSCDSTDSGHCSIDAVSNLLANHHLHHHHHHTSAISASTSSPPNQRRSYPLNPHSKILMASGVSEDKKQNLVSYPSQDSTRSSGITDISGQYFAECHQQTIRRTNSIPNSSTSVNTDHSKSGHNQEMGEQISRV